MVVSVKAEDLPAQGGWFIACSQVGAGEEERMTVPALCVTLALLLAGTLWLGIGVYLLKWGFTVLRAGALNTNVAVLVLTAFTWTAVSCYLLVLF